MNLNVVEIVKEKMLKEQVEEENNMKMLTRTACFYV